MKKILVTQRLISNSSYYEIREALDIQWGSLFKELGYLPIILPSEVTFEEYFKYCEIDGVLFTGGNDLSILNNDELSIKRDNLEKEIISYILKNNIPLLGVCRGMQIIADYFNMNLVTVDNQVAIRHSLVVNNNSKYYDSLSQIKEVNSYHNYAIKNVSENFLISATNDDGIIKAIEHKTKKIFAQMWHSEREIPFNTSELKLIRSFFEND